MRDYEGLAKTVIKLPYMTKGANNGKKKVLGHDYTG
ncbi:MAG: hypothetical protein PWP38_2897, partial [Clostridiales bacterium]|nr:hypothetical protein [Clostridiales bacterium]